MSGSDPSPTPPAAAAEETAIERLIRESRFTDAVINSLPGVFYLFDDAGRYLRWNRNLETLTGYTHEEIAAMHPLQFFEGSDKALVEARIGEVFSKGESWAEARLVNKDRTSRPFYFTGHKLAADGKAYLVGMGIDLTELEAAQQAVRQSEERFRQLAEHISEVFWVANPTDRRLQYISPAFEDIWGRPCAEVMHGWIETVHAEDRPRLEKAHELLPKTGRYELEYRIVRPDGAIRWIRDRASAVRSLDGSVERLVGAAEDITERRKLEEQFLHSQRMEAVGQLSGGLAHDFNNILTAIMGHAALIQSRVDLSPIDAASLLEISRAAERAADLTRQLLTFSRKQVMALRDLELNEVLRKLTKMIRPIVGEHIRMHLAYAEEPLWLHADRGMIEQVVLNLVVNARDAMPQGGRLELSTALVDIDAEAAPSHPKARPGAFARLSLCDTGGGIADEHLDRVFEPFFTTKDVRSGTGLGLSTVYGIVQQHGGWISLESTVGQGTSFHIYLPRLVGAPVPPAGGPSFRAEAAGGGETILVVEDEPMVSFIVRSVLTEKGYRIYSATTGLEALGIWTSHSTRIDLLLTDLVMPDGISGRELAQRLREDRADLPVVFTSGYDPETSGEPVPTSEGTAFLAKPFTVEALYQAVRASLAKR